MDENSEANCSLFACYAMANNKHITFSVAIPGWHGSEFQDISQRLTGRLQLEDAGQWRETPLLQTLFYKVLDSPEIQTIQCVWKRRTLWRIQKNKMIVSSATAEVLKSHQNEDVQWWCPGYLANCEHCLLVEHPSPQHLCHPAVRKHNQMSTWQQNNNHNIGKFQHRHFLHQSQIYTKQQKTSVLSIEQ